MKSPDWRSIRSIHSFWTAASSTCVTMFPCTSRYPCFICTCLELKATLVFQHQNSLRLQHNFNFLGYYIWIIFWSEINFFGFSMKYYIAVHLADTFVKTKIDQHLMSERLKWCFVYDRTRAKLRSFQKQAPFFVALFPGEPTFLWSTILTICR